MSSQARELRLAKENTAQIAISVILFQNHPSQLEISRRFCYRTRSLKSDSSSLFASTSAFLLLLLIFTHLPVYSTNDDLYSPPKAARPCGSSSGCSLQNIHPPRLPCRSGHPSSAVHQRCPCHHCHLTTLLLSLPRPGPFLCRLRSQGPSHGRIDLGGFLEAVEQEGRGLCQRGRGGCQHRD
ncbi:hypothetical protein BC939DRAFT_49254 [Gamsiella multidivaricata]|uniref:uncharacterized protein n=1 Tax=Gamsiella multidivaricata TaxID=101098 RepID=UPI00221EF6ED|nr:uncharacterized protein BC939DRAFT_49254 [Gamsiella multidivaricata]KAI7828734.1 hypothetical protein BC939DRAFT_49254 [Gamsiella multidivaricata]